MMETAGSSETLATIRLHAITHQMILILNGLQNLEKTEQNIFNEDCLSLMEQEQMLPP
jgi:hypothetical protein